MSESTSVTSPRARATIMIVSGCGSGVEKGNVASTLRPVKSMAPCSPCWLSSASATCMWQHGIGGGEGGAGQRECHAVQSRGAYIFGHALAAAGDGVVAAAADVLPALDAAAWQ